MPQTPADAALVPAAGGDRGEFAALPAKAMTRSWLLAGLVLLQAWPAAPQVFCRPGPPRPAPHVNDLLECRPERALLPPEPPRPPLPPPPSLDSMVRSAEQGDAGAQFVLGLWYHNGTGVPQDYAEAARWLRRAADQGHAAGQFWLGGLYRDGHGVAQELVSAHMWLDLASRSTGRIEEAAVERRDAVAALMTRKELAEARRRAREWKPRSVP